MSNDRSKTAQRLRLAITILFGLIGTGTASASPQISLNPRALDFFEFVVGSSETRSYDVTNVGDAPLVVTDTMIAGTDADQLHFDDEFDPFCGTTQDCAPDFTLAPGASRSFFVVCAPSHPGFFTPALAVTSNAANSAGNSTIALSCTGDAPASMSTLVFSPATIDFGVSFAEPAFPPALDRTFRVTNTATAPSEAVQFQIFVPGTTGNGFFSLPGGDFGFVGPGESQDVVVELRWFGALVSTAPVVLQGTGPDHSSIHVPMFAETAYGRLVFDDPPNTGMIVMPAVAAGETSTLTLRAHNAGDFEVGISDSSAFAYFGGTAELLGPTFNARLAPGDSIQWTLTCTPDGSAGFEDGASGDVGFHYVFAASDFDTFPLFCPTLRPHLTTDPAQVAFGDVAIGTRQTVPVHVINNGTLATDLVAITGGAAELTATPCATLPITLAPGAEAIVDVSFTPTTSSPIDLSLTFSATGADASVEVSGRGFIAGAEVTPSAYDFGVVPASATPSQTFQLHNRSEHTLTVQSIAFDPPADFATTLTAGTTIAAGATVSFDVRATPSMLGHRHATLTIAADLLAAPLAIGLDVLAVEALVTVTTADATPDDYELDLGAVEIDAGPEPGHVTLHNLGAGAITIAACELAGDPVFALTTACPLTIAGGASADVTVAFDPASEGDYRGTLALTSPDLATGAMAIRIHGTGIHRGKGGCASSSPTSLAPLGVLLLGVLAQRRRTRRRAS